MIAVQQIHQYLQTIKDLKIVYRNSLTQYSHLKIYIYID